MQTKAQGCVYARAVQIMYTKKIRRVYVNFYPHPSFTRFTRGRQMQANEIVEIAMDIPQIVSIM